MLYACDPVSWGCAMPEIAESHAVETSMASFIVWLAKQRESRPVRARCPGEVERFLRWQRDQREQDQDVSPDAYLAERQSSGAGASEIAVASDSIAHFQRYLLARD
jgi:hypothetical protein